MAVRDLLILGAGPSGLSAAIAAKQRERFFPAHDIITPEAP